MRTISKPNDHLRLVVNIALGVAKKESLLFPGKMLHINLVYGLCPSCMMHRVPIGIVVKTQDEQPKPTKFTVCSVFNGEYVPKRRM